jgi:hypothetical protein
MMVVYETYRNFMYACRIKKIVYLLFAGTAHMSDEPSWFSTIVKVLVSF